MNKVKAFKIKEEFVKWLDRERSKSDITKDYSITRVSKIKIKLLR